MDEIKMTTPIAANHNEPRKMYLSIKSLIANLSSQLIGSSNQISSNKPTINGKDMKKNPTENRIKGRLALVSNP